MVHDFEQLVVLIGIGRFRLVAPVARTDSATTSARLVACVIVHEAPRPRRGGRS